MYNERWTVDADEDDETRIACREEGTESGDVPVEEPPFHIPRD